MIKCQKLLSLSSQGRNETRSAAITNPAPANSRNEQPMNIVGSSMRRTWTVLVAVIAVSLGAVLALRQMPRDIFPTLGIPTIYVAQPYGGMDPAQMEGYLTYYYEYHF